MACTNCNERDVPAHAEQHHGLVCWHCYSNEFAWCEYCEQHLHFDDISKVYSHKHVETPGPMGRGTQVHKCLIGVCVTCAVKHVVADLERRTTRMDWSKS